MEPTIVYFVKAQAREGLNVCSEPGHLLTLDERLSYVQGE
jgi:hypothetical protein